VTEAELAAVLAAALEDQAAMEAGKAVDRAAEQAAGATEAGKAEDQEDK
jgi:hypothetical protein